MAHARTQIRNALVTVLTGLATTGSRVFSNRTLPIDPTEQGGPCLLVFLHDEPSINVMTLTAPQMLNRQLRIEVRGIAKASATMEDVLDQIALEVETAIANIPPALRAVKQFGFMQLKALATDLSDELERPAGIVRLLYETDYMVMNNAPEVIL